MLVEPAKTSFLVSIVSNCTEEKGLVLLVSVSNVSLQRKQIFWGWKNLCRQILAQNEGHFWVSMFINQNFTTFVSSRVSSKFWWKHKYKITSFLTKCSWVFLRFSTQNFQFWVIVHWPNGVFGLQAGGSGTKLYPRYSGQRWDSLPILEQ